MSFIRPNAQKHTFISATGKLLFSEVNPSDVATYYCVATLVAPGSRGNYLGAYQTASRTSLGFELRMDAGTGNNYEPEIQNGFINIHPKEPKRGGTVQMECFAYGTLPLRYSWKRIDDNEEEMPLPAKSTFDSNNRILEIDDVNLEDGGTYECSVLSEPTSIVKSTRILLTIQSKPFFTYNLTNQHIDVGSKLIWQCEAAGQPVPTYSWYKNGELLSSSSGVTVESNTLVIDSIDVTRDNGMYQCAASNTHGVTFSTAQLRGLEIAPSFEKSPMLQSVTSSIGGDVTIVCDPTAAPLPTYTWLKDNSELSLTPGQFSEEDHYKLLRNGNLIIHGVTQSDQGRYTCRTSNSLGTAEDQTTLSTMGRFFSSKYNHFYHRLKEETI